MAARSRPLSPHLQIYKFTLTMANSIIQRGLGMAMYFGTLLIVLWLGAAALGDGRLVDHWNHTKMAQEPSVSRIEPAY